MYNIEGIITSLISFNIEYTTLGLTYIYFNFLNTQLQTSLCITGDYIDIKTA